MTVAEAVLRPDPAPVQGPRSGAALGSWATRVGLTLAQAVIVIWLTTTIVFLIILALPGDPITTFLATDAAVDPAVADQLRAHYGYDRPWPEQYARHLLSVATLDFGFSISTGQAVTDRIGDVVGSTVLLASTALLLSTALAVVLAAVAQLSPSTRIVAAVRAVPSLFAAVPVFWLGSIVLIVFSFHLRILSLFPDGSALSLLIPAAVLAVPVSAPLTQVLLTTAQEAGGADFVRTARAKGLSPGRVFSAHVLRASLAPAMTVLGTTLGTLIAGSVITETVFNRPGIGSVLLDAVLAQDVPLVQGIVLVTTVTVVAVTLVIELLLPLLDPRIARHSGSKGVARLGA